MTDVNSTTSLSRTQTRRNKRLSSGSVRAPTPPEADPFATSGEPNKRPLTRHQSALMQERRALGDISNRQPPQQRRSSLLHAPPSKVAVIKPVKDVEMAPAPPLLRQNSRSSDNRSQTAFAADRELVDISMSPAAEDEAGVTRPPFKHHKASSDSSRFAPSGFSAFPLSSLDALPLSMDAASLARLQQYRQSVEEHELDSEPDEGLCTEAEADCDLSCDADDEEPAPSRAAAQPVGPSGPVAGAAGASNRGKNIPANDTVAPAASAPQRGAARPGPAHHTRSVSCTAAIAGQTETTLSADSGSGSGRCALDEDRDPLGQSRSGGSGGSGASDIVLLSHTGPSLPSGGAPELKLVAAPSAAGPDTENLVPGCEYDEQQLHFMLRNQNGFLANPDYMTAVQVDLSHSMRATLIDWLLEVAAVYRQSRQTLFLTVNYIDRFLSVHPVDRTRLQLVGITAMLVASKYEQMTPPRVDDFVYISDNTYTREEVLALEEQLLHTLGFRLTFPTPYEFFRHISSRVAMSPKARHLAHYVMERFIQEPQYLRHQPSAIAAAATFISLQTLSSSSARFRDLEIAAGTSLEALRPCIQDVLSAYQRACSGAESLCSVFKKYQSSRFMSVAKIPPPLGFI